MNETSRPLISVVMPLHNALPFLDDSVASILNQSFTDFELVILDDASTDGSSEAIKAWARKDHRIRIHRSESCLGLARSSNFVVGHSQCAIIARMDADDVSHPDRLSCQFEVLQSRPEVVAVGTLCVGINSEGRVVRPRDRWRLVRRSQYVPFPHGSVMFRRTAFDSIGGYRNELLAGEDQDLFSRLTTAGRVVTLSDVLYRYRYHEANTTLFNSAQAIGKNNSTNGQKLAALYMLGAMRLWAGGQPGILKPMLKTSSLKWSPQTLIALLSAMWGTANPETLRMFLRTMIRARDLLAGVGIKEGRTYDWRLK